MKSVFKEYIERSINFVSKHKEYLMYVDRAEAQAEMAENTASINLQGKSKVVKLKHPDSSNGIVNLISPKSVIWKPIDGVVADEDIAKVEAHFDIKLPALYKEYLKYPKFYYAIFFNPDIKLYPKPIVDWQNILVSNNENVRPFVLEKNYFSVGKFSDYGELCLSVDSGKVVVLDYETEKEDKVLGEDFVAFLS